MARMEKAVQFMAL